MQGYTVMGLRPGSRMGDRRKSRMVGFTGSIFVRRTRCRVCGALVEI
jgi:hypothetical protein